MKKILFIHHCGIRGGAGISLLEVLSSFDRKKFDITVAVKTQDSMTMYEALLELSDITVIDLQESPAIYSFYSGNEKPIWSPWNVTVWARIRKTFIKLNDVIERVKPDYIIVNSMTLFWIGKYFKNFPAKKICFIRETYAKDFLQLRNNMIKKSLRDDFYKNIFISNYDMKKTKCENGIIIRDKYTFTLENNNLEIIDEQGSFKNILFMGGNSILKGIEVAVKCMKFLDDDSTLLVLGCNQLVNDNERSSLRKYKPGSDLKKLLKLEKFIKKNNLENRIKFLGNQKDVSKYMAISSVLLFPSTKQHQARPLIEGGFNKIPVIITEFDCTSEFAHSGENCLTFKNGDDQGLAQCILKLKNDVDLQKRLIHNNYEMVTNEFNNQKISEEIRIFFESLV